jgi:RES domain-containing protein
MSAFDPHLLGRKIHNVSNLAVGFDGTCFRNVPQQYATQQEIISSQGSLENGGRFNFRQKFGILYLSCDPHTCLEETIHAAIDAGFSGVARRFPRTIVGVKVRLSKVLDLTEHRIRRKIGITKAILTETDWEQIQEVDRQEAITQAIGRFAKEAGFEAILVPSSVWSGKNLNIFPDNLLASSEVSVVNAQKLAER